MPRRTTEELHQDLIQRLGWHPAQRLIEAEAEALRVPPTSPAAIRHAYASYWNNRTNHPTTPEPVQEGLLP